MKNHQQNHSSRKAMLFVAILTACLAGCDGGDTPHQADGSKVQSPTASSDGLLVSPAVQKNLGITFVTVERRAVEQTMRVPGQFELLPTARRDYHASVSGRVELKVAQYAQVEVGDVIAEIDSPDWRKLQASLTEAHAAIHTADAAVTSAEAARDEHLRRVELLRERIERLADASVRRVEIENELAQAVIRLPGLKAEVGAAEARAADARAQLRAHLHTASSATGLSVAELTKVERRDMGEHGQRWRMLDRVPVISATDAVVDTVAVTSGRWVSAGDELLTAIQPQRLRFRAEALLADLSKLRSGLPARITPPRGVGESLNESAPGELVIGPTAHAADRSIALYLTPSTVPTWAKAGVPGFLEITLTPDAKQSLAIPSSAIVQDGVDLIFFRRDPKNPQRVKRVVADTGISDGRWTQVYSGVLEGDEVVLDGVYQLLAASSATIQKGGHFHADGTFHEGDEH